MNGVDALICPGCHGQLRVTVLEEGADAHCVEGLMRCARCAQWYPLTRGIARLLLPGRLRPNDRPFLERWRERLPSDLDSTAASPPEGAGQAQVQAAFGHKWTRQSWWGMEGESARVIGEWLLPRYGWKSHEGYDSFFATRRRILDAGAGLGRETLRMAGASPRAQVYGLELSECVDEAASHARTRGAANVQFVQADLMAAPFPEGSFDFVLSEGVLHHTPDTRLAFRALARLVAPGGEIGFYVYRKKAPLREFADDHIRERLQGLPPEDAWRMMEPLTRLGQALANLNAEIDVPEDVAVLGVKAGRYDVQRLVYYTMFKCYWNQRLSFDENVQVNFDWYYPRYAWRHTEEEVRAWVSEMGMRVVHECVEESGITVRARRME